LGHKYEDIDYKIPPNLPLPKGGLYPSFPHTGGFAEAKAKRGVRRFFENDALLMHSLVSDKRIILYMSSAFTHE
jgi:hypothetical protein